MIRSLAAHHDTHDLDATEDSLRSTLCLSSNPNTPPTGPGYAKCLLLRTPKTSAITTTTNTLYVHPISPPASPSPDTTTPDDPSILGMAIFYTTYSTFTASPGLKMEDLYIRPEYRGQGYGTVLIQALADEVRRMGGWRLEWSCARGNARTLEFYKALGAREMDEWVGMRIEGKELVELAGRGRSVG